MSNKSIITGSTGIVGSHVLLALLKQGDEVYACKQKNSNVEQVKRLFVFYDPKNIQLFEAIKWVDIDLRDLFSLEDAFEGMDNVYHCAGFVSFNSFEKKQLMDVNVLGTKNVVTACATKNIKAMCYVSSLATFHNLDVKKGIDESVFWKSSGKESMYAFSKYKAELEVWRAIEEGLNAVIVNPGVILSPVFWNQSSARMFHTCYKGNKFYPPGTTAYITASDVANCMLLLMKQQKFGERFILIEGNYSFKSIFSHIQKCFHKKEPFIKTDKTLLALGWLADSVLAFITGRPAVITKSLIQSALNEQLYSNKKLLGTISYQFESSLTAIDRICANYLEDKKLI